MADEGRSIHICVSVDVDRFSDKYLRESGIVEMFGRALGCETPRDVRQHCELERRKGHVVFPHTDCDNVRDDGHCGGHPWGDDR